MASSNVDPATKPGGTTSEFILQLITIGLVALLASNVLPVDSPAVKIVAMVVSILSSMGYTVSRSAVKAAHTKARHRVTPPAPPVHAPRTGQTFVVIDLSGKIPAADLQAYAGAQQRQLREHFAACYDGDGSQDVVRVDSTAGAGEIGIYLHPDSKTAPEGALGFHDQTPDGTPIIHVYLDLATEAHDPWQSISSHEVLEVRGDARLHLCVELDDGTIFDREVCDRVEAESYQIDGVPLSNFNTPECFEPTPGKRERYDWMGTSTQPNQVRSGGYAQRYDPKKGWTQVGEMRKYRAAVAELGRSRAVRRQKRLRAL